MADNTVAALSSVSDVIDNWRKNGGNEVKKAEMTSGGLWTLEEENGDVFALIGTQWVSQGKSAESIVEKNGGSGEEAGEALDKSLEDLEREKAENEEKIKLLEEQITKLKEEVEEDVKVATNKMSDLTEEQTKNINKCVANLTDKLAKGEITQEGFDEQLQSGLSSMGFSAEFAAQMNVLINANGKVSLIELLANEIGILKERNKAVDQQIVAAQAARKSCDPIGFELDGVKYDFFIDKDKNGLLSNENEFLGAQNNWDEMTALDGDTSGTITKDEMDKAGLMVVVTLKDGTQKIMKASDLFTEENDAIDLGTYKAGGTADDLKNNGVTTNILGTDANGKDANQLLGTFGLTVGGRTINSGYQTFDDGEWLDKNYGFSDNWVINSNTNVGKNGTKGLMSEEHAQMVAELREMVRQAMEYLGVSKECFDEFTKVSYKAAQSQKESILVLADNQAKEKVAEDEKIKAAEAAKQAEKADIEEEEPELIQ